MRDLRKFLAYNSMKFRAKKRGFLKITHCNCMKNLLLFFLNLLDSRKKFNFFTKILQFKHESITKRNKNQKEGGYNFALFLI